MSMVDTFIIVFLTAGCLIIGYAIVEAIFKR